MTEPRWNSPYTDALLTDEQLVDEVALHIVCKDHMLVVLGHDEPDISVCDNGIVYNQAAAGLVTMTPFPDELAPLFQSSFQIRLMMAREQFGIPWGLGRLEREIFGWADPPRPTGENLGALLRYFNALVQLAQLCSTRRSWNSDAILLVHGAGNESPAQLGATLAKAGIHFLLVYARRDSEPCEPGTGAFASLPVDLASELAWRVEGGDTSMLRQTLNLEGEYGERFFITNHSLGR